MGLKDKIDKAISEQKILLEAKMQNSEDKIETYLVESRKRLSKIIDFCRELENSANIPQLKIRDYSSDAEVSLAVHLGPESERISEIDGRVVHWIVTVAGEEPQILEGFVFYENTYSREGKWLDDNKRIYDTDQEVIDYLIENIGKWVAIIETNYDWEEEYYLS